MTSAAAKLLLLGSSKGFDILDLAPTVWLDASDAGTLFDAHTGGSESGDGDEVGRWEDKSGNGFHVTQATAASRPLLSTSNGPGGGRCVTFDGIDDNLSDLTKVITYGGDTEYSVFGVVACHAAVNATYILDTRGGGARPIFYWRGASFPMFLRGTGDGPITAMSFNQDEWGCGAIVGDRFQIDRFAKNSGAFDSYDFADATYASPIYLCIGASNAPAPTGHLGGSIAELIYFDRKLSEADSEKVRSHLVAKWLAVALTFAGETLSWLGSDLLLGA